MQYKLLPHFGIGFAALWPTFSSFAALLRMFCCVFVSSTSTPSAVQKSVAFSRGGGVGVCVEVFPRTACCCQKFCDE